MNKGLSRHNSRILREKKEKIKELIVGDLLKTTQPKGITNVLGKQLFKIFCSDCRKDFCFTKVVNFAKHQKKFHREKFAVFNSVITQKVKNDQTITSIGKSTAKKIKKKKNKQNKKPSVQITRDELLTKIAERATEFKPDRIFYVDAARSITSKEGKRYWKSSVVENDKLINSYANGKAQSAIQAEAFSILKSIYYLIEQKWTGKILIYCDNMYCCDTIADDRMFNVFKKNFNNTYKSGKYYLFLARKLAQENNISLRVEWVQGKDNPADWFSRHNSSIKTK